MAELQFTISEEKIQAMLCGEQTKKRRGYRNGSYKRKLTSRVGALCAEIYAM